MKLSTRGRYAVMAMTDLAQHYYANKARGESVLSKPVALKSVSIQHKKVTTRFPIS